MIIPSPTKQIISLYQEKWDTLENYVAQESSLRKLFTQTYPNNTEMDEVLIKVCSLNDFYSTNIFSPFSVAKRIISLAIDNRLSVNDTSLVNDIALVNVNGKNNLTSIHLQLNIAAIINLKTILFMTVMLRNC
jgi:hypothetical protein